MLAHLLILNTITKIEVVIMSGTIYQLYWIHKSEHTDPYSQGYIGVTKRGLDKRFIEHKKSKSLDEGYSIVEICSSTDKDYISELEYKYRPTHNIGMNRNIGGLDTTFYPDMPKDAEWRKKIGISNSKPKNDSAKQACIANSKLGNAAWEGQHHTEEHKKYMREVMLERSRKGILHRPNNRKKVYGDGVVYNSLIEAAETLNVSRQTIHYRIKSDKFNWRKIDE